MLDKLRESFREDSTRVQDKKMLQFKLEFFAAINALYIFQVDCNSGSRSPTDINQDEQRRYSQKRQVPAHY